MATSSATGDLREPMPRTSPASMAARSRRPRSRSPPAATRPSSSPIMALAKAGDAVMLPTPLVLQSQDDARHARHRGGGRCPAAPRPASCPIADDAEPLIDGRVRAVVLVSPNNPDRRGLSAGDHRVPLPKLCAGHGVALIVDETYRDFLPPKPARRTTLFAEPDLAGHGDRALQLLQVLLHSRASHGRAWSRATSLSTRSPRSSTASRSARAAPPQRALRLGDRGAGELARRQPAEIIVDRAAAFRSAIDAPRRLDDRVASAPISPICGIRFRDVRPMMCAEWLAVERGVLCLPGSYFGAGQQEFPARRLRQCGRRDDRRAAAASRRRD